jgi:hypothetical protein
MTDALETLARELDVWGKELFGAHSAGAKTLSAAAACVREIADLRECCCGDGWIDDFFSNDIRAATDAALAAFMEGRE